MFFSSSEKKTPEAEQRKKGVCSERKSSKYCTCRFLEEAIRREVVYSKEMGSKYSGRMIYAATVYLPF